MGPFLAIRGTRKDFIFGGCVAGPLCRLGEHAWDRFWPSGGLERTLSLVNGSLVHCIGWVRVLGAVFGHLGGFMFSGWVTGPLFRLDECLGPFLAIWWDRKDIIFSGWVAGPLCARIKNGKHFL